jgi:hypothetical protein
MDAHVLDQKIANAGPLQDPPPDAAVIKGNADLGLGLTMSGGGPGDTFGIDLRRPDGTLQESIRTTLTRTEQRHVWWWNRIASDFDGTWTAEIVVGDQVAREIQFVVRAQASAFAVEEADLATAVADHQALGLQPVWLDVYIVAGKRFYNLISEPTDVPTELWWDVDAATHQDRLDEAAGRGLRPIHVDAADAGDGVTFVGVVAEAPGAWDVATAEAAADYWPLYDDLQDAGYRPVNAVHLDDGLGHVTWTGLWDDTDVGQTTTIDDILRSDVYGTQQAQRTLGRNLAYLDARNVGNEAYFVGIWDQRPRGDWSVYTLLELPTLEQKHEEKRALGLRLRGITGFARYDQHRFAAWWTDR